MAKVRLVFRLQAAMRDQIVRDGALRSTLITQKRLSQTAARMKVMLGLETFEDQCLFDPSIARKAKIHYRKAEW
ncbi:hypothetical protein [Chitinimonas naiadis]